MPRYRPSSNDVLNHQGLSPILAWVLGNHQGGTGYNQISEYVNWRAAEHMLQHTCMPMSLDFNSAVKLHASMRQPGQDLQG